MRNTEMKSKSTLLGTLVIMLVFGITIIGCDKDQISDEPHQITITGLDGKTGDFWIVLNNNMDGEDIYGQAANGTGTISGNFITVSLNDAINGGAWTGSGQYYIGLGIDDNYYMYTNGQTLTALGIATENDFNTKMPKYNITGTSTTIAFGKFFYCTNFFD